MHNNGQFYIRTDGQLVPVTEEVYREYHKMRRRERYLEERDTVHGKVLYSDLDTSDLTGEDMVPDLDTHSIEDTVIHQFMTEKLHEALEILSDNDQSLIKMLYFSNGGKSQHEAAKMLGISQPAIKKRHDKIIRKLRLLIKI